MHRLFVAFRPPEAILAQLSGLMGGVAGARWQDEANLHLTLRYIGEVDSRVADDVVAVLEGLTFAPLELRLAGVGTFDRKDQGRPLWAGVTPHDALNGLHKKIDHALLRAGVEAEHRAYLPHITLARFGRGKGDAVEWLAANGGLSSAPFMLDHVALYESHIGGGGAHYEEVMRVVASIYLPAR